MDTPLSGISYPVLSYCHILITSPLTHFHSASLQYGGFGAKCSWLAFTSRLLFWYFYSLQRVISYCPHDFLYLGIQSACFLIGSAQHLYFSGELFPLSPSPLTHRESNPTLEIEIDFFLVFLGEHWTGLDKKGMKSGQVQTDFHHHHMLLS